MKHVARAIFMGRTRVSVAFSFSVAAADRDHTDPNRKRVSFALGVTVLGDEKDDDADDASKEYSDESDESDSVVFMGQRNLGHPPRPSRSAGKPKPQRRVTQSKSRVVSQTAAGEFKGLG